MHAEPMPSPARAGVLKVMFLPLDVAASRLPPAVPAVAGTEPFLPARIADAPGADHVERAPSLLAFRHLTDPGDGPVAFGPVRGPAADTPPSAPGRTRVGAPGACASLWEVPGGGLVLVCEELTAEAPGTVLTWHSDPLFDGADTGFRRALDAFLAPFRVTADAGLVDVFPRLDTRLPDPAVYRPLREVVVRTARPLAGERTVEGLVVEVAGDGFDAVRRLVGPPRSGTLADGVSRASGRLRTWHPEPLADAPVRAGARLGVRDDARAMLVDLGAADRHGYLGDGTREMLYHLICWVGARAHLHTDRRRLLGHLRTHRSHDRAQLLTALDEVADVRARLVEVALLCAPPDDAPGRIAPTRLRSLLAHRASAEIDGARAELTELCATADLVLHRRLHTARPRPQPLPAAPAVLSAIALPAAATAALLVPLQHLHPPALVPAAVSAALAVAFLAAPRRDGDAAGLVPFRRRDPRALRRRDAGPGV
ncbi:hypothetical protein [Rhodococcus aetherivorans]